MTTELTNAVTALNDVTQKHEQLNEKYQGTHDALASNSKAMTDWQTQQGTVELTDQHGNKHPTPTLKTLVEQAQSVNPHPHAMTKAQFDALRELRKQQYSGSGFVEWGKHFDSVIKDGVAINEGMWCRDLGDRVASKFIHLGRKSHFSNPGSSHTDDPITLVDGTAQLLYDGMNVGQGGTSGKDYESIQVPFPPAPDGTKTYDSATGTVTQHNNAEVAFASETATNKVITSRKDLVFLESWHEKIADKDVVYPLGNVQYGASSYEGVTLLNNLVAQGYSAFGEWDENTKGYGAKWSSLTDAQKALFLSEPEHNIYFDPQANAYIQVRYRIRVVEGNSDIWPLTSPTKNDYFLAGEVKSHVAPQGNLIVSKCLTPGYPVFLSTNRGDAVLKHDNHIYGAVDSNKSNVSIAHNGKCFALPIALVQRMNQGAYHPVYNPMGCRSWNQQDNGGAAKWHSPEVGNVTNIIQAFDIKHGVSNRVGAHLATGSIEAGQSGRSDQYKYYDAIYAGQVQDLRLNANKLDVNKLREDAVRKAVAGKMRGKGRVPFTFVMRLKQWTTQLVNQGWVCFVEPDLKTDFYTHPATKDIPRTGGLSGSGLQTIGSFKIDETVYTFDEVRLHPQDHRYIYFKLTAGTLASTAQETNAIFTLLDSYKSTSEFDSLPWVDIIGDPERIAATFPDGVVGQWVPQIPNTPLTVNQRYEVTNKSNNLPVFTYTQDDGVTWVSRQSTSGNSDGQFDSVKNTLGLGVQLALIQYESHSNFTEPSNSNVVIGNVGDIHYTTHSNPGEGNRLQGSLTGEIGKATADPAQAFAPNLGGYKIVNGQFSENSKYPVKTGEVPLAPQGNNSPAVKALSTITEKNGLYYLQLHGAELKHTQITLADMTVITAGSATGPITKGKVYLFKGYGNALINRPIIAIADHASLTWHANVFDGYTINSIGQVLGRLGNVNPLLRAFESRWGDDQTIPIIDGENVKTDLNGNTVKVFCHHTQIPLGIAHND
ncbi:hypothetical protein [Pseudoalteromonas aurantia]|uniref:Uncharacterized protein n=1 Tax=Pseudoalteromonas aurantia TaxID=43654 RepID=A0ABY2VVB6_9GAMM|nr:hypothetical protein [Pseudoalteromonas aurantia]TMO72706.1 hypothetical protein CWC20_14655 [Pseudoalteromonas aurantia]